jgi:hypothetical protein
MIQNLVYSQGEGAWGRSIKRCLVGVGRRGGRRGDLMSSRTLSHGAFSLTRGGASCLSPACVKNEEKKHSKSI